MEMIIRQLKQCHNESNSLKTNRFCSKNPPFVELIRLYEFDFGCINRIRKRNTKNITGL